MKGSAVKIDKEIFLKYLRGTGSDEDRKMVIHWMEAQANENELLEESFKYWDAIDLNMEIPEYQSDHLLNRLYHFIRLEEGKLINGIKPKTRFISYLSRIAAVITVPLLITTLAFYFQNRSYRKTVSWTEIHAPYGTRADFSLPDGSKGTLNGGSTLKFPILFMGKTRVVELAGEAYFDVVSDKKKPFIVSTKDINVNVTGTSFNVMAYADEHVTEVTLKRGKVEVFKKKDNLPVSIGVLKPYEISIYNSSSDSAQIKSAKTMDNLSWLDGKLIFRYEPFEKVIYEINRWYNVDIVIKDKLLFSYVYYGTFQNETLDEVLKLLQYTSPIIYKDFERQKNPDGTFNKRRIEVYYKR
jgi:transmembrane sensor